MLAVNRQVLGVLNFTLTVSPAGMNIMFWLHSNNIVSETSASQAWCSSAPVAVAVAALQISEVQLRTADRAPI